MRFGLLELSTSAGLVDPIFRAFLTSNSCSSVPMYSKFCSVFSQVAQQHKSRFRLGILLTEFYRCQDSMQYILYSQHITIPNFLSLSIIGSYVIQSPYPDNIHFFNILYCNDVWRMRAGDPCLEAVNSILVYICSFEVDGS